MFDGSLNVIHGWPVSNKHRQHLAPERNGLDALEQFDFARVGQSFVFLVTLLECRAVKVVQIRRVVGTEKRPVRVGFHAFHEQVGNPVRRVHVVRAAAFVAGVFAQLQKIFDVEMPRFKIRAHRAFAFAALIDGDGGVVGDFQKRNHALARAIRAFDMSARGADIRPIIAESARPFRQLRVVADDFENMVKVVHHGAQIART